MSAPFGIDKPTSDAPWQYSLKTFFGLTTIVSVCLAIGVHFAGFMLIVVVVGLMQAVILLSADWLIRPANRRALAFVTAGSWIVFGSGVAIIAITQFHGAITNQSRLQTLLATGLTFTAVICFYTAAHRWRTLTAHFR